MYEPERRIDVAWARDESTPSAYPVKLTVFCDDRYGMLKLITGVIGDAKSNIRNIEARTQQQAVVDIVLDITDSNIWRRSSQGCARFPACGTCRDCRRSRSSPLAGRRWSLAKPLGALVGRPSAAPPSDFPRVH